jgi:ABC-2 type transport system ATP-binding protein
MTLTLSHLGLRRGKTQVIANISLDIDQEIFGILGINGAGKTTFLECIANEHGYSGEITFDNLTFHAWTKLHKRRFSVIYDRPIVYDYLTVDEYVSFIVNIIGAEVSSEKRQTFYDGFGLDRYKNSLLRTLSFGNKRKSYMMPYLLAERHLMLLDEPTNGLDTQGRLFLEHVLKQLRRQGCTILVSSHDIDFLTRLSDRIGILAGGTLNRIVPKDEFLNIEQIYLDESGLEFK